MMAESIGSKTKWCKLKDHITKASTIVMPIVLNHRGSIDYGPRQALVRIFD